MFSNQIMAHNTKDARKRQAAPLYLDDLTWGP